VIFLSLGTTESLQSHYCELAFLKIRTNASKEMNSLWKRNKLGLVTKDEVCLLTE
jgi:hypothetical protein